ncbi:MAG: endonuclease/exonuclease/phosphatase family protein [Anaerolineae bacterium]
MNLLVRLLRFTIKSSAVLYLLALVAYLVLRGVFGDRLFMGVINSFAHLLFLPLILALPLLALLRSRWSLLGLVLLIVAGTWFGSYFLPKFHTAATGNTLKVVTFNVWRENTQLSELETWLRSIDADVILIQEYPRQFPTTTVRNLQDVYPYWFTQQWVLGNIILSKYPFIESQNFDPAHANGVNQQRAVIDWHGQPIAIYNVHLSTPMWKVRGQRSRFYVRTILGYDDSIRNHEIASLIPILQAERLPYIIAGDFNLSDHSVTYDQLAAFLGDTYREAGIGMGKSWPRPNDASSRLLRLLPPLIRIDYIWHSAQWRAVDASQGPYLGSDHLAVVGVLTLN